MRFSLRLSPARQANRTSHTGATALSPVTANFFKYVPPLTTTGSVLYSQPSNFGYAEITARVDQELTPKDKLTERYFSDEFILQGVENLTNILSLADGASNHYYNSLISETHTFNDHIVNNFIISDQHPERRPRAGFKRLDVADLGVNIWQPAFKQIYQIQVAGYFTISVNPAGHLPQRELHADRRYPLPDGQAQHRRRLSRRGVEDRCRIT